MTKASKSLPVLCLCVLCIFGCGDNPPPTILTAGASGSSDSAVSDSSDSSAPTTMYPRVSCGSATCTEFPGVPVLPPCCFDSAQGTCGKQSSTGKCVVPPPADPRCPAVGNWPGCCTANGMCGADVSVFGFGCEALDGEMFRKFNPNAPTPRHCDGTPLFAADAGASPDAG
jgi:hypothetical protein